MLLFKHKWIRRLIRTLLVLFLLLNISAAFHAYKLTHNYKGRAGVHKGPDKMSFFEKSKAILFGVRNIRTSISNFPSAPYETINLFTSNNLKIEGWLINRDSAQGTVILFHGHLGNKGSMVSEAGIFNDLGFNTLLIDFRAHGGSDGTASTIGWKEAEEVKLAYDFIRSRGETNITLWGTSMGAAAICHSFQKYELDIQSVILEMPFASLSDAVKGRVRMMGLPQQPVSGLLTFWGGAEHGFWAFNFRPCDDVKKIKCPVLLQWGERDKRVSRKETMQIFENIVSKNKSLTVYPGAGHESLFKNDSTRWKSEMSKFLK